MPLPGLAHSRRSPGITPEKQRLMKALELRKKQMNAKRGGAHEETERAAQSTRSGAMEEKAESSDTLVGPRSSVKSAEGGEDARAKADAEAAPSGPKGDDASSGNATESTAEVRSVVAPEDSGIETMGFQTETDDQHSAVSASSPTSAQTQGSSAAPSTRPSSVSEDDNVPCADNLPPGTAAQQSSPASSHHEDEDESTESTPTIVPERGSSVPADSAARSDPEPESAPLSTSKSDDALLRKSQRESMVFVVPPADSEHVFSSEQANRASVLFAASKRLGQLEKHGKRRPTADPIRLNLSAENSDAEYLSDDSFMEELQSAKVEQAQHVSVSKSPIAPFFPRKSSIANSVSEITIPERSSSQPNPGRLFPEQPVRKTSGPWLPHAHIDTVVVAKKINVSSGISQRIKALAEKSNRDSTASVSQLAAPDASSSLVARRKSSFFATPPTGNSPNGKTANRPSHASFASLSHSTTPDQKPVMQPLPPDADPAAYSVQREPEKPESVQVTARIVRDARTQLPSLTMPNENTPLALHQSPITIDHQKSARSPSSKTSPARLEPTSSRPPSSSQSKEQSVTAPPRSSSESSWRSFGRRLSESRPAPRSQSAHSFESTEDKREEKRDKKDSRTSKLFRRMSNISSLSRKNQGNAVLQEEDHPSTSLPSLREPPPAVQVGDLNVQFPDTLVKTSQATPSTSRFNH